MSLVDVLIVAGTVVAFLVGAWIAWKGVGL